MNQTQELFNDLYKNVRMASYAIDCIQPAINDEILSDVIHKQNNIYLDFTNKLETLAKDLKLEISDINPFLKASSFSSIKLNTLMNDETNHLCSMLIEGTSMGVITTITAIADYPNSPNELIDIALAIKEKEELFIESLKDIIMQNK